MTVPAELLEILVCPRCKGGLRAEPAAERLVCSSCQVAYPVRDGIPIMLVDEAVSL